VPLVCLVLGASAGHGALTAPLCDFVAMTETASIFAAGPPLVRSATGEDVTKEALGGPEVAIDSGGVVHNLVADDGEAIDLARRYLAHFPLNAWELHLGETGPTPGGRTRRRPRADPSRSSPAIFHPSRALGAGR
jgi:acetyl-CoA carboxylase carboxyltransferase component